MNAMKPRADRVAIVPAVRIMEDEAEVLAQIEMPGVTKDGLEIKVDGNILTIEGKRADEVPAGRFLIRERRHADYHKAFSIDESIDRDAITADLVDGVLNLRLKMKEAAKPRRIAIT